MRKEKKVKYIAFYNDENITKGEERITFLSITNKVNYILNCLQKLGYSVEVISPCWTEKNIGYIKGSNYRISDNISMKTFNTFGNSSKFLSKMNQVFSAVQLFFYVLFKSKRDDIIIVYHSLGLMLPVKLLQYFQKKEIIIEVEEIYSKVWEGKLDTKKELEYLNSFNRYICVSDIVKGIFPGSKSIVLYGAYEKLIPLNYNKKNSYKTNIDIVYAGEIEDIRRGALNAVLCMNYLPNNYRLHILGFGDDLSVSRVESQINIINSNKKYECCIYYGRITGKDYHDILFNCDIGVNPQKEGEYMDTAFPSKVLSYLSHNLVVVSTNVKSIKQSSIESHIIFSKNDDPKEIADTILQIKDIESSSKTSQLLIDLDNKFLMELDKLLKDERVN